MGKLTKQIESASEYREAIKAAETLGLEPTSHSFHGDWTTNDGHPLGAMGECPVEKAGYEYFHVELTDGSEGGSDVYKIKPKKYNTVRNPGTVTVTFRSQ